MQQIDVIAPGDLSTADVYFSLQGPDNDTGTTFGTYVNGGAGSMPGVSLLDPTTSADDLAAALDSLPSAGKVSVRRVPATSVEDTSIASRHLVTFLSRGGDVPLLVAEKWTVNGTGMGNDTDTTLDGR